MNRSTIAAVAALTIAITSACDQAAEISSSCSIDVVGAEINPSDLFPVDGMPDHRRWVAGRFSETCTEPEIATARVQLFGTNPEMKFLGFGLLDSVNWEAGCATWIWSATTFENLADFLVIADAGKADGRAASVSSLILPDWVQSSVLPAWKVKEEWSLYLPHPKHEAGCEPLVK